MHAADTCTMRARKHACGAGLLHCVGVVPALAKILAESVIKDEWQQGKHIFHNCPLSILYLLQHR